MNVALGRIDDTTANTNEAVFSNRITETDAPTRRDAVYLVVIHVRTATDVYLAVTSTGGEVSGTRIQVPRGSTNFVVDTGRSLVIADSNVRYRLLIERIPG